MKARIIFTTVTFGLALTACNGTGVPDTPEGKGAEAYTQNGCQACHGKDGKGSAGPALTGIYNTEVTLADGTTVQRDEGYLKRAIEDPSAQKIPGFSVAMPDKNVSSEDLTNLIAYLKTL